MIVENQTAPITSAEIDFDNGLGFQTVAFDVPINVPYNLGSSTEVFAKTLRLRLHYDSKVVESRMTLFIVPNAKTPDLYFSTNGLDYTCQVPTRGFTPDEARVSVRYGNPDKVLKKPVIIAEGFESTTKDYGYNHFENLASGVILNDDQDTLFKQAKLLKEAFDSLNLLGYDIVYVDNKNPRDFVQANALNLIKTIQWVNEQLAANGSHEKPVVLGASMGGLVARYALAKMEADGCCHNVRLYMTFDTPHNGANIPEGLQHTVKHLHDQLGWVDDIFGIDMIRPSWARVLNSPAARQMLAKHIEPSAAQDRANFMHVLDSLGHPKQARRVAVINGSEKGKPNAIQDAWKTYILCEPKLMLPSNHFMGGILVAKDNAIGILGPYSKLYLNSFAESRSDGVVFQSNDFSHSLSQIDNILHVHGKSASDQIYLARQVSSNPLLFPVFDPVVWSIQSVTNAVLPTLHSINTFSEVFDPWPGGTSSSLSINYSEAPGGTTTTAQDIADALDFRKDINIGVAKLATVVTPSHNFIPSISALDLDTNDLYLNIRLLSTSSNEYTPFDTYWAPGRNGGDDDPDRNMQHIEVTKDLYRWLIEQIDLNDELRHPQTGAYHKTLAGYYNFGRPTDFEKPFLKHLYSVDIVNGGNLHINKFGTIGYVGGAYNTNFGSQYACYTGQNCEQPHVKVQAGGLFEIGDANNRAEMHFQENSTLEIFAGGTLRINNNSTLFLEAGATLIIHPGATIELAGSEAVLDLQGKVRLEPSANFAPTGSGRVRFAQPMGSSANTAQFWETHPDNSIKIVGQNGELRAQFVESFFAPQEIDSVVFQGASATLAPGKKLFVPSHHVRLENSIYRGSDTTQMHHGVHLTGQPAVVKNTRFSHGQVGLMNELSATNATFYIEGCNFTHNYTGMQTNGGTVAALQCTARYNQNWGWAVLNYTRDVDIAESIFAHNSNIGLVLYAQNNSTAFVRQSAINNNDVGLQLTHGNLRPTCNLVSNNTNTGIAAESANLLLLNENAMNEIKNNNFGIAFSHCVGIFLEDGYNNFSGNTTYIYGELNPLNANPHLDVLNNLMPGTSSGGTVNIPVNVFWTDANNIPQSVPIINWAAMGSLANDCTPLPGGANGNEIASNVMRGYASLKVVNTNNYSNVWLHDALADAAYKVSTSENTFDDLLAIARFSEILSGISGPFTEPENLAINYASELMVSALSNAIEQGLMPLNEGQSGNPEHPYLQMVTAQLNDRIGQSGLSAEQIFEMSLSLAQSYRMAQHYDYALNVLDSVSSATTPAEVVYTDYWTCVCEAENNLLNEVILPEDFAIEQENCRNILQQYFKWQSGPQHGSTAVNLAQSDNQIIAPLQPNPANHAVMITLRDASQAAHLTVFDATGKAVHQQRLTTSTTVVDVANLSAGIYMLKIEQAQNVQYVKLVVAR